ncbi:MAG: hypothetical protein DRN14_00915 [Thermoplasmata archaeon]|nr:MAG: hypothetical protein DRN14_00915 [Thermoplasmata archaeon]HDJ27484.1 hypothetical protein [Aciduliprofundum sp.]
MRSWTALILVLAMVGLGGAAGVLSQGSEVTVSGTVTAYGGCHMFFITADNGTVYGIKVMGWWEDPNGSTISSCYLVSHYVDLGEEVTVTGYLHGWGHHGGHWGHGNMVVATVIVLDEGTFQRRGGAQTSVTGTVGEVNVCCRYFTLETSNGTYYVKVTGWWENESGETLYCTEVLQAIQPGDQVTVYGYSHGGSWIIASEIDTQSDTYTRMFGHRGHEYTNETTTVQGTIQFLGCRIIRLESGGQTYTVVLKGLWMAENGTTYTPCQLTSMMSTGEQVEVTGYQAGQAIMAVSIEYQGVTYVQVTSH